MNPIEALHAGCEILNPIMNLHGFVFVDGFNGKSSGGFSASGEYIKGKRKLELHFRWWLGIVIYHMGAVSLDHESYMRALLGRYGEHKYPGSFDAPLEAFHDLRSDLEHYCSDFLHGSGEEFRLCAKEARDRAKVSGFKRLYVD